MAGALQALCLARNGSSPAPSFFSATDGSHMRGKEFFTGAGMESLRAPSIVRGGGHSQANQQQQHQQRRLHNNVREVRCAGTTSNGASNGATSSSSPSPSPSSSFSSRMLPIDVALAQIRGGAGGGTTTTNNGASAANGRSAPLNGTTMRYTREAATGNGTAVRSPRLLPGSGRGTPTGTQVRKPQDVSSGTARVVSPRSSNGAVALRKEGTMGKGTTVRAPKLVVGGGGTGWEGPPDLDSDDVPELPSDETFRWAKDNYSKTQRSVDVWTFVLSLRAGLYFVNAKWSYVGGFSPEKQSERRRALAAWVRESILQLGPTFIKLGQLSSTRSDIFPAEFVSELSKLQDRVPAFTADKAISMIEAELGQPIDVLFKKFERRPIAAASLGQVHRAILPNGELVVVKIQRPGLKELFDIDLGNMKIVAEYFQSNEEIGGPTRDWVGIYQECATILYQEIDYLNEGRNADRFRNDFRNLPWAKIPLVYWDYASRKVLTLEYCPGVKINDVAKLDAMGLDKSRLARLAVESYLIQILRNGFFHADPHPGNLAVDTTGSLVYYDFGMMGDIKSVTKGALLELFYAVYEKDASRVLQCLIDLGALVPTGDLSPVRRSVQYFLDNLMKQNPGEVATVAAIGEDLFAIAVDQPFRFPATFTFVLRAFSTLEGIGNTLEPEFSFAAIAEPFGQELLRLRDSTSRQELLVSQLQKQANEVRDATLSMPSRVQNIDGIMRQLESGDLKLRVRVLESERAARKAGIMQIATLNTVAVGTLLNLGVTLSGQGLSAPATTCFAFSSVFAVMVFNAMKRIKRLDRFEKML